MVPAQVLPADIFVCEYGGNVCAMPAPEVSIAIEVYTREEPWLEAFKRMVDHLKRGVTIVFFLSEQHHDIFVYRDDTAPRQFKSDVLLEVPDLLPGFSVPVTRFFE